MSTPSLSIVIPTREGFADHWFNALTEVKGEVEFILVHPPGAPKYPTSDPRLQQIVSPLRGEIIQRATGLMNATAPYILTINCDEYINPDISEISSQYFSRFPDSWVMRLSRKDVEFGKKEILEAPWLSPKPIEKLEVCGLFGLCYAMEGSYKGWNPYIERHLAIFVNCFLSRAN
nr:hypothetical protein [Microcystis aeruginosa]